MLVVATDRLRLLKVPDNIMERIPPEKYYFLSFALFSLDPVLFVIVCNQFSLEEMSRLENLV